MLVSCSLLKINVSVNYPDSDGNFQSGKKSASS